MSIFLQEAMIILKSCSGEPAYQKAQDELSNLIKTASMEKSASDAIIQNVINLLTPFVMNYKVNQVMKLMKELSKEKAPEYDPSGNKNYIR